MFPYSSSASRYWASAAAPRVSAAASSPEPISASTKVTLAARAIEPGRSAGICWTCRISCTALSYSPAFKAAWPSLSRASASPKG